MFLNPSKYIFFNSKIPDIEVHLKTNRINDIEVYQKTSKIDVIGVHLITSRSKNNKVH